MLNSFAVLPAVQFGNYVEVDVASAEVKLAKNAGFPASQNAIKLFSALCYKGFIVIVCHLLGESISVWAGCTNFMLLELDRMLCPKNLAVQRTDRSEAKDCSFL